MTRGSLKQFSSSLNPADDASLFGRRQFMQSDCFVVESQPIQRRCEVREADVASSANSPSSFPDRRVFRSIRPKLAQQSSGRRISIAPSFLAVHDSPNQQHRPVAYSSTSTRSHLRCQADVFSVDFFCRSSLTTSQCSPPVPIDLPEFPSG